MRKFMERLIRKILGIPKNINVKYVCITADSLKDAQIFYAFMKKHVLEGNADWEMWNSCADAYVIEKAIPETTGVLFDLDDEDIVI